MGDVVPQAASLFVLLNAITMISFIFGGIVPAAPNEFQVFIQRTLDISPDESAFYLGTLETAFVATYCLSSIVVGVFSKSIRPFRFMSYGLVLWVAPAVMCGAARSADNFYVLCIGRIIEAVALDGLLLWWNRIGCGIAYLYGSVTARHLGWDWSFYLCAIAMTPLIYFCHVNIPASVDVPFDAKTEATTTPTSVSTDILTVLRSPIFVTSAVGLAAVNFSLQAMITFVFIGLRLFNEAWSSTIYGALVVVTGAIGSPVGGLVLDRACAGRESEEPFRLLVACRSALSFSLELWSLERLHRSFSTPSMLGGLSSSWLCLAFASLQPLAARPLRFSSVCRRSTAVASGFALTIQNLLGNVPGPITLGYVKKWLAPGCGSIVGADNKDHVYPECFEEHNQDGLRKMWLVMIHWMAWALLFWPLAYVLARRRYKEADRFNFVPLQG
ncbi:hypothetical protein LEN26_011014 [Aphanomyces euteiches]|nr:hypothetical protein AeMF1_016046 [Aphanomyces euteiches]KAH9120695.1 hypothetical protein LEN26_011014 [Aphanomyces euteiches]KAH9190627.1 hypothetical protein AeNC1_007392 [Aphanomyces euteiches]